jgi:hypothetical protein
MVHGKLRFQQSYTPAMLVHESRILADEVDAQLTQSMDSYMDVMRTHAAA